MPTPLITCSALWLCGHIECGLSQNFDQCQGCAASHHSGAFTVWKGMAVEMLQWREVAGTACEVHVLWEQSLVHAIPSPSTAWKTIEAKIVPGTTLTGSSSSGPPQTAFLSLSDSAFESMCILVTVFPPLFSFL